MHIAFTAALSPGQQLPGYWPTAGQTGGVRPRLLDLFCGAGGAAVGYHRAGFDVVGVDLADQPRYPFEFHRADAMTYPLDGFDAIHASPPCQAYSDAGTSRRRHDHPDLVAPVRARLIGSGLPYVIENIPGAPLRSPFVLCGSTFGLPIIRHRLFETNPWLIVPKACNTNASTKVTGHPGGPYYPYARGLWRQAWRDCVLPVVWPWMTLIEAGQAVPPAYTEHIGAQLLDYAADVGRRAYLLWICARPGQGSVTRRDISATRPGSSAV